MSIAINRFFMLFLLIVSTSDSLVLAKPITIYSSQRLESANVLANHVAVQGMPYDIDDNVEVGFWRRLAPRTEGVGLIGDADYLGAAIHVHRLAETDPRVGKSSFLWKGPFGPNRDLWLDTEDFDKNLLFLKERLNHTGERVFFSLGGTPRVLSANPEVQDYMHLSPVDYADWEAVVAAAVKHLAASGYRAPVIFGPDTEPPTYFRGLDRPKEEREMIARDYAEMFVHSARATEHANPNAKLIAPGDGTYSNRITRDLQRDPRQWGIEDFLGYVHEIDPHLVLRGISWQGYYWYGLDGFGKDRLLAGANHVADLLEQHGQPRDLPQFILGWSPTAYNSKFDDTKFFTPKVTKFYRETVDHIATHVVSEAIRFSNPGGKKLIDTAFFYTWNGDGTPGCGGGFARGNLVSTVHAAVANSGDDGTITYTDCNTLASEVACPRAPFEAMMFLRETSDGDFVQVENANENIKVAAVRKGESIKILAAHTQNKSLSGSKLQLRGLKAGQKYAAVVRTIHSDERLCGVVNKIDLKQVTANRSGTADIKISGKEPMFLLVLKPQ